ncbi:uncharacterized protein TNCV_2867771 [Trichonephila clavipes]|nr:uncharacterized protein TNCV_2867771 [Trichonephila clavipes]
MGAVDFLHHGKNLLTSARVEPNRLGVQGQRQVNYAIQPARDVSRPMTLLSPTENSLAVLNHKILEANSQVQNGKLGGHQTCLSINRLWHELWDMLRRLVGTTAPGHHDFSIQE